MTSSYVAHRDARDPRRGRAGHHRSGDDRLLLNLASWSPRSTSAPLSARTVAFGLPATRRRRDGSRDGRQAERGHEAKRRPAATLDAEWGGEKLRNPSRPPSTPQNAGRTTRCRSDGGISDGLSRPDGTMRTSRTLPGSVRRGLACRPNKRTGAVRLAYSRPLSIRSMALSRPCSVKSIADRSGRRVPMAVS